MRVSLKIDKFFLTPQLAAELFQEFINEVHTANSRLTISDSLAEDFVEKLMFLDTIKAQEDSLNLRCSEIQKMYDLIDQYEILVPEIDKAAYATLNSDFTALKNSIEEVESMKDDNIHKFSLDLEAGIDDEPRLTISNEKIIVKITSK